MWEKTQRAFTKFLMDPKYYKTVLLPITVSASSYCWGPGVGAPNEIGSMYTNICPHFDNEGGHPYCEMGLDQLKYTPEGFVLKPAKCLELQNEVSKTTSAEKDEKKAKVSKRRTSSTHSSRS